MLHKIRLFILFAFGVSGLHAQTFTALLSFAGTNGSGPAAGLVEGMDGNLYGTTKRGGSFGAGTVFNISRSGTFTTLYNFCSLSACIDGRDPQGMLVLAANGSLYGTTYLGGVNGGGTVFSITSKGVLTTLYNFCSQPACADGKAPTAGLIQASNGDFYGTTYDGGAQSSGSIFEITSTGALTTLYNFCSASGCADGSEPSAGLIQGADGNFYGTAMLGGTNSGGTIYEFTASGTFTTLYNFCSQTGCKDGAGPSGALFQAQTGDFYGTTGFGGTSNSGTVFQLTTSGALTTIYRFCALTNCADGRYPYAGVVEATDGNFYGTTELGGSTSSGAVFKMAPTGTLTTLYNFCSQTGCTDGSEPFGSVVQATNGAFYGTTAFGGASSYGSVYELSTSLRPFVQPNPTAGSVGEKVHLIGDQLTGATSVQFNGTTATFNLVSQNQITATVPKGSTSGYITVVLPAGTLTSNVYFNVLR